VFTPTRTRLSPSRTGQWAAAYRTCVTDYYSARSIYLRVQWFQEEDWHPAHAPPQTQHLLPLPQRLEQTPVTNFGTSSLGLVRTLEISRGAPIYLAHRAVFFAIAQLSCTFTSTANHRPRKTEGCISFLSAKQDRKQIAKPSGPNWLSNGKSQMCNNVSQASIICSVLYEMEV